jgi:hypothetical protein
MTLTELIAEANRLSRKIDEGVRHLSRAAGSAADAERTYRLRKAKAWLTIPNGTVPERQAQVDAAVADERYARDIAEGERLAALEALRSRRQQASLLQSIAAAYRAEAEHSRYGPEVSP